MCETDFVPILLLADKSLIDTIDFAGRRVLLRALDDPAGRSANLLNGLIDAGAAVCVDPCTDYLFFSACEQRAIKSPDAAVGTAAYWRHLASPNEIEAEQLREWTSEVIAFQRRLGATEIIAPYAPVQNLDDKLLQWTASVFNLTRELANDARVWFKVAVRSEVLSKPEGRAAIEWLVRGLAPDGVMIKIYDISDRSDEESLLQYAALVKRLSEVCPVWCLQVGSFGLALLSVGAVFFSSGLQWLDYPRFSALTERQRGYGGGERRRGHVYVPLLLRSVPPETAMAIAAELESGEHEPNQELCEVAEELRRLSTAPDADKAAWFLQWRRRETAAIAGAEDRLEAGLAKLADAASWAEELGFEEAPPDEAEKWYNAAQKA